MKKILIGYQNVGRPVYNTAKLWFSFGSIQYRLVAQSEAIIYYQEKKQARFSQTIGLK
jgi:hypothetical protein